MSPRWMLDTDICLYIGKARPVSIRNRLETLAPGTVCMSVITFGELRYGAERSQARDSVLERLTRLAELVPVVDLPDAAGRHYGRIRAALAAAGTPIGNNDLWIAAHVLASNMILVTNNEREFSRVPLLRLENWAKA
jgi:tRNA(fMet)-specific endonuclease VapC